VGDDLVRDVGNVLLYLGILEFTTNQSIVSGSMGSKRTAWRQRWCFLR
jgi:hypothetical protein